MGQRRGPPSHPECVLGWGETHRGAPGRAEVGEGGSAGKEIGRGAECRGAGEAGREGKAGRQTPSPGSRCWRQATSPGRSPAASAGPAGVRGPFPARRPPAGAPRAAHLVALGGLLQRRGAVAAVLGARGARRAQRRLVLLAEEAELLAVPRALRAGGAGAGAQLPQAVHQAGQLPVGAEALAPEGAAALRAGEHAALRARRAVAELGDAAQAEAVAAVHAHRLPQEVQAHGAPRLLPQPLPRRPRGHARAPRPRGLRPVRARCARRPSARGPLSLLPPPEAAAPHGYLQDGVPEAGGPSLREATAPRPGYRAVHTQASRHLARLTEPLTVRLPLLPLPLP